MTTLMISTLDQNNRNKIYLLNIVVGVIVEAIIESQPKYPILKLFSNWRINFLNDRQLIDVYTQTHIYM